MDPGITCGRHMTFRVLSIDGGGMRGLYSASYLAALEDGFSIRRQEKNGLDISSVFDLIVGTSTGAIIGCGLAHGVTPKRMARLYRENARSIFPVVVPSGPNFRSAKSLCWRMFSVGRWNHLAVGENGLRKALLSVFGDITLGQLYLKNNIALAIPSVDMGTYKPWVFKTPHLKDSNGRDNDYSVVDVCLASSAAPIFRSLAALKKPGSEEFDVFADGGLWANNPIMVALVESLRILKDRDALGEDIEIYCLGTFDRPDGKLVNFSKRFWGLWKWKFGGEAATLSLTSQSYAFTQIARQIAPFLKTNVTITQFPQGVPFGELSDFLNLDETREKGLDALMRQARRDADSANSMSQDHEDIRGQMIRKLFDAMLTRQLPAEGD